ncbi:hypothetical protein BH09MYX1_BH09MYX1_22860 [soil metagenome]
MKRFLALVAVTVSLNACTNPTASTEEEHPDWLKTGWSFDDSATLYLHNDGTYTAWSTLAQGGAFLGLDSGRWHTEGAALVTEKSGDRRSFAVTPVVGCHIIKLNSDWLFNDRMTASTDCPQPEPLTDAETCISGAYHRHEDHSVHSTFTTYTDTDDTTVTLAPDHAYRIQLRHFDTDGYVSHSGGATVLGRWTLTADGQLGLTPLVYASLSEAPTEITVSVTKHGRQRDIGDDTYVFTGGCE